MPEHRMAEQSSGRSGPGILPMGQFVDERDTVFHCPELRRHRQPVAPGNAHAQMAGLALLLGDSAKEGQAAFFRLPAIFIDGFIIFPDGRSEEHTSELQSLMPISYAVFCLKKKKPHT